MWDRIRNNIDSAIVQRISSCRTCCQNWANKCIRSCLNSQSRLLFWTMPPAGGCRWWWLSRLRRRSGGPAVCDNVGCIRDHKSTQLRHTHSNSDTQFMPDKRHSLNSLFRAIFNFFLSFTFDRVFSINIDHSRHTIFTITSNTIILYFIRVGWLAK